MTRRFFPFLSSLLTVVLLNSCKNDLGGSDQPGPPWVVFGAPKIPSNVVTSLYTDRQGRVWVGTLSGAAYYSNKSWATVKDSLAYSTGFGTGYTVNCITEGRDRSIWFGMRGGGLVRYNEFSQGGNVWTRYRTYPVPDFVTSGAADLSNASTFGELWFGSDVGATRFIQTGTDGGGTWTLYGSPPMPNTRMPSAATDLVDNTIWLGSAAGGAVQISYTPVFNITPVALPAGHDARITSMVFDANKTVWFGKETEISSFNPDSSVWNHYNHLNTPAVPVGEIHAVEGDYYNTHWFGTDSGLVLLSGSTWSRILAGPSTFPNDTVTALKYDGKGNLWIGTRGGIAVYNSAGTKL